MADSVRGNGPVIAERALVALIEDPERLDRARRRFSESPPTCKSHDSLPSTLSRSPNPPSERQKLREERKWKLIRDRDQSRPYYQFGAEWSEEKKRILREAMAGKPRVPVGTVFDDFAKETVKRRWVEQGIWNNEWDATCPAGAKWKHEPESDSEDGQDSEPQSPVFSSCPKEAQPKQRQPKSDEEKGQIAERQATQEREASRPFFRFVYQVSRERGMILDEWRVGEAAVPAPADVNTRAYENIKSDWIERGIWNQKWGVLPGMSWKHEEPLEVSDGSVSPQTNTLENDGHELGEAPATPPRSTRSSRTVESSHGSPAIITNKSEPEICAESYPAVPENHSDVGESPSKPKSPQLRRAGRPAASQVLQPSKRSQVQSQSETCLGAVHSSKVSKAPAKHAKQRPRTRPRGVQPAGVPPRRSKRLQART